MAPKEVSSLNKHFLRLFQICCPGPSHVHWEILDLQCLQAQVFESIFSRRLLYNFISQSYPTPIIVDSKLVLTKVGNIFIFIHEVSK